MPVEVSTSHLVTPTILLRNTISPVISDDKKRVPGYTTFSKDSSVLLSLIRVLPLPNSVAIATPLPSSVIIVPYPLP